MSKNEQRIPKGWAVRSGSESENATPRQSRWERELDLITGNGPKRTRTLPIRVLTDLLVAAKSQNSGWLDDFAEDVVTIDADLHDVLLAYEKLQRETVVECGEHRTDGASGRSNMAA